jgi:glycine/D-amino acid oxidase-like deaminating enzyme
MQVDFLIVGQGISGTWLSYYLQKVKRSFLVIDNNDPLSASRLAAGIINPVTGRRHVQVWMAEEILPNTLEAYTKLGTELGIKAISSKTLIDFFPSPQMRVSFMERVNEKADYINEHNDPGQFLSQFNYEFGCGEIKPVYTVHLESILPAWRQQLLDNNLLIEESFDASQLIIDEEGIAYKDIKAGHIIFCNGIAAADHPYFRLLPFAPNKGELLILSIPAIEPGHIYKKGMMLAPLSTPGQWWLGSSYAWEFDHPAPTNEFRERSAALLSHWLKVPFTIEEHLAGIRPATLERRPFVGLHPVYRRAGILNGMGTKGCSLAPFFAKQLSDHLCHGNPIHPEADIKRFARILSR